VKQFTRRRQWFAADGRQCPQALRLVIVVNGAAEYFFNATLHGTRLAQAFPMMEKMPFTACFLTLLALPSAAMAQATQAPVEIQRAAEAHVGTLLGNGGGQFVTHVTAEPLDTRLRLARCTQPLSASLPASARLGARATVGVSCAAPQWSVYLTVNIETQMPVAVLRNAGARGAALTPVDVEIRTIRVPGLPATYITSVEQLADRHLKQTAAPGTALTVDLLAADVLVKRGQRVLLVAQAGGIEVRAQGEAVADARPNGRVRVLNLSSRRIVEGQVEGRDRVRVSL
jgi:flagellar basal body P-ring formation protein FlgA